MARISRRRYVAVGLALAGMFLGVLAAPTSAQDRPLPSTLWGVTLDNTADIGPAPLQQEVAGLEALPVMPISRIVMDVGTKPDVYDDAVDALHPASYLMAELGDSSEMKRQTVAGYDRFESALVDTYSADIDLWEIGNEVNGEWVGSTHKEVAKISAAYDSVKAVGGATALTLSYNPRCFAKKSHEMFRWAQANIPASMKDGLDDVLISYYPDDCHNFWPTAVQWQSVFDQLHAMFPHARLGFGESGISTDKGSEATKAELLTRFYTLDIAGDNYAGGSFWWYFAEDALPYQGNDVWNALRDAMTGAASPSASPSSTATVMFRPSMRQVKPVG